MFALCAVGVGFLFILARSGKPGPQTVHAAPPTELSNVTQPDIGAKGAETASRRQDDVAPAEMQTPPSGLNNEKSTHAGVHDGPADHPPLPDPKPDPPRLPKFGDSPPAQDGGSFDDVRKRSQQIQDMLKNLDGAGGGEKAGEAGQGGPGNGPDDKSAIRQKRLLRWNLVFDTSTGDSYRRQLIALGAILAVPQPGGRYMVIRDLKTVPAKGKVEDLSALKRIFWIDQNRDTVSKLAAALGLTPAPEHFVAFFPERLENELFEKERKYRGLPENRIGETRFEVRPKQGGQYEPVVIEQTEKR